MAEDTEMQDVQENEPIGDAKPVTTNTAEDVASLRDDASEKQTTDTSTIPEIPAIATKHETPSVLTAEERELSSAIVPEVRSDSKNSTPLPGNSTSQSLQEPQGIVDEVKIASVPTTIPAPASEETRGKEASSDTSTAAATHLVAPNASSVESHIASDPKGESGTLQSNNIAQATGSPARVYLKEHVNDFLLEGMRWLALNRPENGLLSLGQYLCSADAWRRQPANAKKSVTEFQRHWLAYQAWLVKGNAGKSEAEFRAAL